MDKEQYQKLMKEILGEVPVDYSIDKSDQAELARAIIIELKKAGRSEEAYIEKHTRKYASEQEKAQIARDAHAQTFERVSELRRKGRRALSELALALDIARRKHINSLMPGTASELRKASDMRPTIRRKVRQTDPGELLVEYGLLKGPTWRYVFIEESEAYLQAILDEPGRAEDRNYRARLAAAGQALDDLRSTHFADVDATHNANVALLDDLKSQIEAREYGATDVEQGRARLSSRFGVRFYDAPDVEPSLPRETIGGGPGFQESEPANIPA